jgi:hypothetical protein
LREEQVVWLTTVTPAWIAKDAAQIEGFGMTRASYAARFSVPLRIRLMRVDGR